MINHRRFKFAEISRLKDVVDLARSGQPLLFLLVDCSANEFPRSEVGRARRAPDYERSAIGLATTHDLALAEIADHIAGKAINAF